MENGAIDYQYWNLVIALAGVALSFLGTLIQGLTAWLVWFGIRVMNSNAKERAIQSERRHEEAMRKHEENMAAIKAEAEESKKRHEEAMKKHEENMAALKALIERTGG